MREHISRFPKKHLLEMLNQYVKLAQKISIIINDSKQNKTKVKLIKDIFEDTEIVAILLGSVAILNKLDTDKDEISAVDAEYSLHREIYTDDYERGARNRASHEVDILLNKLGIDSPDED
jgi:hypothetical protein